MKKIIVYYPFQLRDQKSGSAVRPVKLLEAFEKLAKEKDLELIKIYGSLNERKDLLQKLYSTIDPKDILMCYMENATIPIWLTDQDHLPRKPFLDIMFFNYLKKHDIPLGVFYRDIYWKFNDLYNVNKMVKPVMQSVFKLELALYKKYADTFFLPSFYMNEYVGVKNKKVIPLPPGGIDLINEEQTGHTPPNGIYVGGIHPRYGIYEVLEAYKLLNEKEVVSNLHLVCREDEFAKYGKYFSPYIDSKWLTIYHAFGEELKPIYKKADYGIVPIKKDIYNDFAVAVKMFEYLSYGLPMIATHTNAQKDLVNEGNFGVVVKDETESILDGLKEIIDNSKRLHYKQKAVDALKTKHLWIHRAETIFNTLVNE